MTGILENYSLKELNTFGFDVKTRYFARFASLEEVSEFLNNHRISDYRYMILGEGSNIVFLDDFDGLVLHPVVRGMDVIREDELFADIKVGAGENWDRFVSDTVEQGYSGLENLSLIPGMTGSAPVQNIGAYGVEVKNRILWVEGIYLENNEKGRIFAEDCKFGYRQSIFKQELKNRFLITHVCFRLDKHPRFELGYGILQQEFRKKKRQDPASLRETIIEIRSAKLPDPSKTGNAGSFFKNPVLPVKEFGLLQETYPGIPSYPADDKIKIPAAWLIEKAGWKGVRENDTGTWPNQPLVIVNYGRATGLEVFEFSEQIRTSVKNQFGIDLEREVNIV
ncbi:MAG TPA: UDP-N-acetylmuramate dehydrogenase [Bacteroidales bacterium]|nr:UDP-N-acetylmuramate dehydrogenase [Bacteroidales bacterium]